MKSLMLRISCVTAIACLTSCAVYADGYGPYGSPYPAPQTGELTPPPPPPPPQPRIMGRVSAIYGGDAAFVGTSKAAVNQRIFEGDHFYTQTGTKMEVSYDAVPGGGTILIDQNTDPTLIEKARCFFATLSNGRMTVRGSNICVQSGTSIANQRSYVLYEAVGRLDQLSITVIEGQVVTIRPSGITINAGEQLLLRRGQAVGPVRRLTPAEITRQLSWVPVSIL